MSDRSVIFHADLTAKDLGGLRLALTAWRARCQAEAGVMDKLAEDPTFDQARARANAAASRDFDRQAAELLERLDVGQLRTTVSKAPADIAAELELEPQPIAAGYAGNVLAVGQVLYASWGYEQTNVDFYRVEKIAGAWVWLQEIEQLEASDGAGSLTGRVVPADPIKPKAGAEPFRRKILNGAELEHAAVIKIKSYAWAYRWDGRPMRVSHYA